MSGDAIRAAEEAKKLAAVHQAQVGRRRRRRTRARARPRRGPQLARALAQTSRAEEAAAKQQAAEEARK
jgi:hypothetical protein